MTALTRSTDLHVRRRPWILLRPRWCLADHTTGRSQKPKRALVGAAESITGEKVGQAAPTSRLPASQ